MDFSQYTKPTGQLSQGSMDFSQFTQSPLSKKPLVPSKAPSFQEYKEKNFFQDTIGEGVMEFGKGIYGSVGNVVGGAGNVLGGIAGGLRNILQGKAPTTGQVQQMTRGGTQAISGVGQFISTPFSAGIKALPQQVQTPIEQGLGMVGQGLNYGLDLIPRGVGAGVDKVGQLTGNVGMQRVGKQIGASVTSPEWAETKEAALNLPVIGAATKSLPFVPKQIQGAITKPSELIIKGTGKAASGIAKTLYKTSKPLQTYIRSAQGLTNAFTKGKAGVDQVASKLDMSTGDIRSLSKHIGDKDFIKQVNIAEQMFGRRVVGAPTPLRVPSNEVLSVGKFIENKVGHLENIKSQALKEVFKKRLDIKNVKDEFVSSLRDYGVSMRGIKNNTLQFSRTSPFAANAQAQKLLKDTLSMITKGKGVQTVADVHAIRKALFSRLDEISPEKIGTSSAKQAAGEILGKVRQSLANKIEDVSPQYKSINAKQAKAITALDDLKSILQIKNRFTDISKKGLKMEEVTKRLLGRAADRPLGAIENLYTQAKELGWKGSFDNFKRKVEFADMLEDITGTAKTTGLQGEIVKAGKQLADTGVKRTVLNKTLSAISRTPDAKAKLQALKTLLDPSSVKQNVAQKAITQKIAPTAKKVSQYIQKKQPVDIAKDIGSLAKKILLKK